MYMYNDETLMYINMILFTVGINVHGRCVYISFSGKICLQSNAFNVELGPSASFQAVVRQVQVQTSHEREFFDPVTPKECEG